ncbi:hypothetical protein MTO96_041423, partial [Rhipicephalus appendiculatus]
MLTGSIISLDENFSPTHFLKTQRCDWARGKALGGTSVINFQLYVRGNKRDFDRWEKRRGAKGWSYKDVLPYFKKFENYKVPNANSGFSPMQATVCEGRRWSSAKSFIRPVHKERARNLHISLMSRVTMIVFDNKRAVGVKFIKDGQEKTVKAKREDHVLILGTAATTTNNVGLWPQSATAVTEYAFFKTGPLSLPAGIEATAFMNTSYGSREYPDFQLYLLSVSAASVEGERFMTDIGMRQD